MDKAGFATKVKVAVKATHWVLYAQKIEQKLMVIRILALATYQCSEVPFQTQ